MNMFYEQAVGERNVKTVKMSWVFGGNSYVGFTFQC